MFIELFKKNKRTGRTPIKLIMHEIHTDNEATNKNGIHWKREYVEQNMESAINAPLVAEFLDEDMDVVAGHGEVHISEDGDVYFEDSTVVGSIEKATIEEVEVNGEMKTVLVAHGYLYDQRVPNFVKWLKSFDNLSQVNGSVEISGKYPNKNIVYEGEYSQKYRIPKEYDYSGMAILFTEPPADDSSVLLEINKLKEDSSMDKHDKILEQMQKTIEDKDSKISELNSAVSDKDKEIQEISNELNQKVEELDATVSELNDLKEKMAKMESELNELREYKQEKEKERLTSELNAKLSSYADDEKEIVKEKIEKFNQEPSDDLLKEIVNELNSVVAQKILEERKKQDKKTETNSHKDILGDVYDDDNSSVDDLFE